MMNKLKLFMFTTLLFGILFVILIYVNVNIKKT